MADLVLAALLGFAVGVLWQEFHFRDIKRQLDAAVERMERLP